MVEREFGGDFGKAGRTYQIDQINGRAEGEILDRINTINKIEGGWGADVGRKNFPREGVTTELNGHTRRGDRSKTK